jgi:hypothetical protein
LHKEIVLEEIEKIKLLTKTFGLKSYLEIISSSSVSSEESIDIDWDFLYEEVEKTFFIKVERGQIICDRNNVDLTWWSSKQKIKADRYYWNRYKSFLQEDLPSEVITNLDDDTDAIMNQLGDPALESFRVQGMVVGHVQSGKTANYSALIAKAADAGYKFIVVIAGTINNLRNQTQNRLFESFIGEINGQVIGSGKYAAEKSKMPISLTNEKRDFNKHDADKIKHTLNFDNIITPILIVIKKETSVLKNVVDWLSTQYQNGKIINHAMLLIDDESDYASINTKSKEDPTIINKSIRTLLSLFVKTNYVAFTATPYANIFIDHNAATEKLGNDLFPKDFIYLLEAPSNYMGARHYFVENREDHIVNIYDYEDIIPEKHKKELNFNEIPESLKNAICQFLINVAIRHLKGNINKHNSMLVHVSRFTEVHKLVRKRINEYLTFLEKEINAFGKLGHPWNNNIEIGRLVSIMQSVKGKFEEQAILNKLIELESKFSVKDVHSQTKTPLVYLKDAPQNVIVVGGLSLARGYTLEGLSVSYFIRTTILYDTLMQMGRWFGYRIGYEDLCKVYLPTSVDDRFVEIFHSTEELFSDFRELARSKRTPEEFGLAVKQNPSSALQITARNKLKDGTTFDYEMNFNGKLKETVRFNKDQLDNNFNVGKKIVESLLNEKSMPIVYENSAFLWEDVTKSKIVQFLEDYKLNVPGDDLGIISRMPIKFILEYLKLDESNWDVAIIQGEGTSLELNGGKSKIKFNRVVRNLKEDKKTKMWSYPKNQLSNLKDEAIPLLVNNLISKNELGKDRNKIRKLRDDNNMNPLLILYFIESENGGNEIFGFSLSFSGSVLKNENIVRMTINTVYYQQMMIEALENEEVEDES